jgi:hypothetical protein
MKTIDKEKIKESVRESYAKVAKAGGVSIKSRRCFYRDNCGRILLRPIRQFCPNKYVSILLWRSCGDT